MSIVLDGTTGITTPGLTNTGTETLVNLTTTGNTILGDASTDTLNVGNGGLIKDASGNVGVGVTPSAWSGFRALQVGGATSIWSSTSGASSSFYSNNVYYNGTNRIRINAGFATEYIQDSSGGAHIWYNAASSTAGSTISFTQAMTLDASGRLMVGVTSNINSSTVIQAGGISNARIGIDSPDSQGFYFTKSSANNGTYRVDTNGNFEWYTKNVSQAMVLDVSGNLLVGTTSSGAKFRVYGNAESNGRRSELYIGWSGAGGVPENYYDADRHIFRSGSGVSEYGRFDTSGNLLVGTTSALAKIQLVQATNSTGAFFYKTDTGTAAALALRHDGATGATSRTMIEFGSGPGGSIVGTISSTGSATAYNTSSDYRLKENIQPMQNALATVSQLKPVTYTWKLDGSAGQGFIAHELQAVVPNCVTGEKDAVDEDSTPIYQGIDTSFLVATLTAAIQEQQAIIQSLTDRLTALENK